MTRRIATNRGALVGIAASILVAVVLAVSSSKFVGGPRSEPHPLLRLIDNSDGGQHFESAESAHRAVGIGVPDCPGLDHFALPRPDTLYGHFVTKDLQLIIAPRLDRTVGPAKASGTQYAHFQIHGLDAAGWESDRKVTRVAPNITHVAASRSYIEWREKGAFITMSSDRDRSLQQLKDLVDSCVVVG